MQRQYGHVCVVPIIMPHHNWLVKVVVENNNNKLIKIINFYWAQFNNLPLKELS